MNWDLIICFAITFPPAANGQALAQQYQLWREKGRWEGVRFGHQVGGERMELTSAVVTGDRRDLPTDSVYIGFNLSQEAPVALTVRLPEARYWMEPADKKGAKRMEGRPGLNVYRWDRSILNQLNVHSSRLHAPQ